MIKIKSTLYTDTLISFKFSYWYFYKQINIDVWGFKLTLRITNCNYEIKGNTIYHYVHLFNVFMQKKNCLRKAKFVFEHSKEKFSFGQTRNAMDMKLGELESDSASV